MIRNISSAVSATFSNNLKFSKSGSLFSLENALRQNFSSEIALNEQQPQKDKLFKKVEVEVRGNDPAVLKSYGMFSTAAADHLGITIGRNMAPMKSRGTKFAAHHERWTVLKCKHIYKKHKVQYEIRTYYRYMDFLKLTESTADTFLEYIQRNLPEGVAMKVTKIEINPLPESLQETAIQS